MSSSRFANKQYNVVIQSSTNLSHEQYRICTEYYSVIDDRIVSMYIYIYVYIYIVYMYMMVYIDMKTFLIRVLRPYVPVL
jgi:hypothetical protein